MHEFVDWFLRYLPAILGGILGFGLILYLICTAEDGPDHG